MGEWEAMMSNRSRTMSSLSVIQFFFSSKQQSTVGSIVLLAEPRKLSEVHILFGALEFVE